MGLKSKIAWGAGLVASINLAVNLIFYAGPSEKKVCKFYNQQQAIAKMINSIEQTRQFNPQDIKGFEKYLQQYKDKEKDLSDKVKSNDDERDKAWTRAFVFGYFTD